MRLTKIFKIWLKGKERKDFGRTEKILEGPCIHVQPQALRTVGKTVLGS